MVAVLQMDQVVDELHISVGNGFRLGLIVFRVEGEAQGSER